MTTKHTPGPWKKAERLNGLWWHISAESSGLGPGQGRQAVACVHGGSKRGAKAYAEMSEANARLIAAAPDLLEALREIMPFTATAAIGCHGEKCREPWCHSCNGEEEAEAAAQKGCDAYAKARAAIAKATGEQS